MAFQTRSRDPLLDTNMAQAIEKRGKELIGLILVGAGIAAAAMIGSYSPDDPNWLVSTDAPVQNWLGPFGASAAAVLYMIVGLGAWAIPLVLVAWGLRFVLHRGEERWAGRVVFAPIFVAVASLHAATLVPGAGWSAIHSFGLGGLFGDTVLGALLTLLPVGSVFGVKLISLLAALVMLGLGVFVLGFARDDVSRALKLSVVGVVLIYGAIVALLGRGAQSALQAARHRKARQDSRQPRTAPAPGAPDRRATVAPNPSAPVTAPVEAVPEPEPKQRPRAGILARVPNLLKKPGPMPEPELVEPQAAPAEEELPADDARIRAKIANVVRARVQARQQPAQPALAAEPPLTEPPAPGQLPPEPPLTAARSGAHAESARVAQPAGPAADGLPLTEPPAQPRVVPAAGTRKVVQHPPRKAPAPSRRAREEAQPALAFEDDAPAYEFPPLSLLTDPASIERYHLSDEALEENARMLENVLDDYGVKGEIVSVRPGPVVTMYELEPAPGLKASRVIGLADDIARSMSALSARVSTVPGRSVIGIELPNDYREKVLLREILSSRDFGDSNLSLPLALGKDIGGDPVVANLARMPHLLIAGTTGSGKSVAINTMILSLLYKLTPEECRLIMIDPKMLELSVYDGIPHLLSPVVTDPKKAVVALKWVVGEMEERYRKMSKMGVRNIEGYNGRVREALARGEMFTRTVQTGFDDETGEPIFETEEMTPEALPYIVVVVDEMADLMMVAGKEIEACIQRLAQMARASGIHLIMATQRPSVDVITGTIKANFPTRISFQVTSKVDSRTILGEMGAEQLLGMGDMLYMAGGAKITRCHGPFVSDEEVEEVVNHLKQFGPPDYVDTVLDGPDAEKEADIDLVLGLGGNTGGEDALYDQAVAIVIKDRKCSTSYIQRKLAIGYNKAARLVEQMEEEGLVSPANHVGKREILVPEQQ